MKKQLIAALAFATVAGSSAIAADLPVKAARPIACTANWFQGGYIGIHGGGANFTANRTDRDEFLVDASTYVQKAWGGEVGGHIGYNWTTCHTLWGVEVDGSWAFAKRSHTYDNFVGNFDQLTSRLDGIATARVRTGIVLDNLLLYITGGAAAVHTKTTWSTNFGGGGNPFVAIDRSAWNWGWAAGFGAEWRWSDRVSLRSETLYIETLDRNYSAFVPFLGGSRNFTDSNQIWLSRVALNYKF